MSTKAMNDYLAQIEDSAMKIAAEANAARKRRPVNTERQLAIAALWNKGFTTKVIAKTMGVSTATVNNYRTKLGLPIRMPAVKDRVQRKHPTSIEPAASKAAQALAGGARG